MTSVVAAGNGHLSDGFYRSIAPEAKVVLVKIGKTGRIPESNIETGLRWVFENKDKYDIRIVNISAGGDFEQSYLNNSLCQLVEEVVKAGLTVVCAVGNAGLAAGTSGFAACECAVVDSSWWSGRSELTRSRAARNVSFVVWSNDRWTAKTGSDRAGNLGCRSDPAAHADRC